MKWTREDSPDLSGKVAIVTGSNTGLGYENAADLARNGARVILAVRSAEKGEAARARIVAQGPLPGRELGEVEVERLDLGDLESVKAFGERVPAKLAKLDILVNNAGVMIPPRSTTAQGYELQFGVNYLGHFALTGPLLPVLAKAPAPRIVTVSSLAHVGAKIDFENFRLEKKYVKWREYQASKLACLIFAFELHRRLEASGHPAISLGAHPGVSMTELSRHLPGFLRALAPVVGGLFTSAPWQGSLPTLYAAIDPGVTAGAYYGPTGFREMKGWPGRARVYRAARDEAVAERLWEWSTKETGVSYEEWLGPS